MRLHVYQPIIIGRERMKDVYLFSGFLGSGKTSMLTDVIRQFKEQTKERITKTWYLNVPGYTLRNSTHVPAV